MNFTTLFTVSELASHLQDADLIVCDCRHDLVQYNAGRNAYQQAHIPGARFLHLDEDLSGPKTGVNGRHPLPHPITFTLRLAALGIDNRKQVVAYDNAGGVFAARLWWMLRWVGHTRVAVLDGGIDGWIKAGQPVTAEYPPITPATYNPNPHPQLAVDTRTVQANLRDNALRVMDARSPDRFRGENETLDPVAGHIPGAVNRFFKQNLGDDGRFKTAAALQQNLPPCSTDDSPPAWCISAARASPPATICWRWKWRACRARACIRAHGASGSVTARARWRPAARNRNSGSFVTISAALVRRTAFAWRGTAHNPRVRQPRDNHFATPSRRPPRPVLPARTVRPAKACLQIPASRPPASGPRRTSTLIPYAPGSASSVAGQNYFSGIRLPSIERFASLHA